MAVEFEAVLSSAPDHVWVGTDTVLPLSAGEVRSYLDDGRTVVWTPPLTPGVRRAVDAERRRVPPPIIARAPALRGSDDFWAAWTQLEVLAKLMNRPVVTLLRTAPAEAADVAIRTFQRDDVAITVGIGVGGTTPRDVVGSRPQTTEA